MKFVVKNFYLFRAESLNREQLENRTWKLPAKIFQVLQRTARGEFFDFLRDAFADSGNFGERFLILQIGKTAAECFDGARGVHVSANFERVFALQFH